MGLGGFTHSAGLDLSWFTALGFRMGEQSLARMMGSGKLMTGVLNALHKNATFPVPLGLERDGEVLLKPYCPPYYASMEDAVLAFIATKFAEGQGAFRRSAPVSAWKAPHTVQSRIPPIPQSV